MIHNDVLNQLQLLIKTSAPPLIEVAQTPLEEAQWVPGQRLTAVVLATLPNGRFQVQVGDSTLDMNLPLNSQPGDQVELTFVSNQPRLTFALSRDLPSAAAATAGNLPGLEGKPQVTVSDSARYLGALLQKISDHADTQAATVSKAAPLLSAAPSDIKEFAASLRNTLSQSGLFYESHQAQWVAGERSLTNLMQEPQGKLPPLNPVSNPVVGTEIAQKNMSVLLQSEAMLAQGVTKLPLHAEAVTLVQQQLQTLDTRQLVWQGQVWTGQVMEWRVDERGARESGAGEEEMPHWQTSLRLQLPRLGDVQAKLAFTPQGLRIDLKAADVGTADAMRGSQEVLRKSMEASGLSVMALSVERHEKT